MINIREVEETNAMIEKENLYGKYKNTKKRK